MLFQAIQQYILSNKMKRWIVSVLESFKKNFETNAQNFEDSDCNFSAWTAFEIWNVWGTTLKDKSCEICQKYGLVSSYE